EELVKLVLRLHNDDSMSALSKMGQGKEHKRPSESKPAIKQKASPVCMPTGEPSPVFFYSAGREFEGEEEYLEILGITREQSGKYECKAANEVASADVKQVRVTVNYPPTITESKSNEAATGRQALLRCEASAVPTPDFEWYRDDTRINSANGLEIKSTGSQSLLMVANVTEEHYGNYTCVAANKLGVTNASLYLYSDGTWEPVGNSRLVNMNVKNVETAG
ncbi:hypothetical protein ASZ78_005325, partial [Callipepla squamata]